MTAAIRILAYGILADLCDDTNANQMQTILHVYFKKGKREVFQTMPHPTTVKEKLFANKQKAVRKDIEWAFDVLQMGWAITHQQVLFWNTEDLNKILRTCIILHNMIIEDEGENILQWTPPTDDPISLPHYVRNTSMLAAHISSRLSRIRNRSDNADLRRDLMEHLWNQFGDEDA
ncbi:uncharacterized protein LOC132301293 [Cornus florida]|uniref:uncharacterized protein LOC132301293 n=1 Tax=Cornus florida TaxID=4283 RepID=UPI00289AC5E6|nr:uncharacterized protein LOC132301293 [Cornus florida]